MRDRRKALRLWMLAAALFAWLVATAPPAGAHSIVKSTEPGIDEVLSEPPGRVLMRFNEPVELAFGAIRVFDTRGRRVDLGLADHLKGQPDAVFVTLKPDLPQGTYVVSWRIISADSHPIQEAFLFHVGRPGRQPTDLLASVLRTQGQAGPVEGLLFGVARWVNFVGLLILAGAATFYLVAWRRPGSAMAPVAPDVEHRFLTRWRLLLTWSWVAVVAATLAGFILQGAVGAGVPLPAAFSADILRETLRTRFGGVAVVKLALLAAVAAIWLLFRRLDGAAAVPPSDAMPGEKTPAAVPVRRPVRMGMLALAVACVVALLATPGLAGHAGTSQPASLNIATDLLHVLAAAVWLGGLLMLVVAAFPATRTLGDGERTTALAPVVSRFSNLAVIALATLVATGIYRSWVEVRALRAFTEASYGVILLTKLAAFLPILALGAVNNRWTRPRIARAARDGVSSATTLTALRRLVTVEVALGAVVLALTAFLVNLPPARVEAGVEGPFVADVGLGEHRMSVGVTPNEVGENTVHMSLTTAEGLPADAEEVRVLFRMPANDIGPIEAVADPMGPGAFEVHGHQLSVAGPWTLEIVAVLDRFTEERATVDVTVNP